MSHSQNLDSIPVADGGGMMYDPFIFDQTHLTLTTSTETEIDYTLSNEQEMILSAIQFASALLSLIGSCTIVFKILRSLYQTQTTTPYDRIILGLSSCDIVASAVYAVSPFLLPSETSQRVWAMGNDNTCKALGFLTQLSALWAIWYNCILSFYYLLTVRFQVKRHEFFRKYEIWFHLSGAIFFPLTSLIALAGNWYGEQALIMGCWVRDVPYDCNEDGICAGDATELVGYIYGGLPMFLTMVSVIVNNIVIYLYVRKSLLSSRPSAATNSTVSSSDNIPNNTDNDNDNDGNNDEDMENSEALSATSSERQKSIQERLTNEAAVQGFLYVSTFLLTALPVFVLVLLDGSMEYDVEDKGRIYPLLVLNALLVPLQGFFNVCIYVRPSYSRFRAVHPDKPLRFVLKRALFESSVPRMTSTSVPKSSSLSKKQLSKLKSNRASNFSMNLDNIVEEDSSTDDST